MLGDKQYDDGSREGTRRAGQPLRSDLILSCNGDLGLCVCVYYVSIRIRLSR